MWQLFDNPAFAPFIISGLVLLILLLVEIVSFFFGGMSGFLDSMLPEGLGDADFDADAPVGADGITIDGDMSLGLKALDWLYVGRIPTMILLILFIMSFCVTGIILQQLAMMVLGSFISPWLASFDAVVISIPILKVLASLLYPILPKDESSAISSDSLIGRQARIVLGHASIGLPAQAKLTDEYGQSHYIMVEPDPSYSFSDTTPHSTGRTINIQPVDVQTLTHQTSSAHITADDRLIITKKIGAHYLVKKL